MYPPSDTCLPLRLAQKWSLFCVRESAALRSSVVSAGKASAGRGTLQRLTVAIVSRFIACLTSFHCFATCLPCAMASVIVLLCRLDLALTATVHGIVRNFHRGYVSRGALEGVGACPVLTSPSVSLVALTAPRLVLHAGSLRP